MSMMLLLHTDRSDPVSCAILNNAGRFDREVIAISLSQLLSEVVIGSRWTWAGRTIDPARTAVVNRLTSLGTVDDASRLASPFVRQQMWGWLHHELQHFAYASSLPTATSLIGCYGSLLDQWSDLPLLVGGLRVPRHRASGSREVLQGDVYVVNPWNLYSLGKRASAETASVEGAQLAYIRPSGQLIHIAQVGGTMMFANAPPEMTAQQRDYMASFAKSMAALSASRILEHAFFVGDGLPVFYSTCPMPVISGTHPAYADLVVEGLQDDIERRSRRTAS
jgi:hypothetical protein